MNNVQSILCDLCADILFRNQISLPENINTDEILAEAKNQTVFPLAFSALKNNGFDNKLAEKEFFPFIARNVRVNYAHSEICGLLNENNIPYVVLKGVASAVYYNQPTLRSMGDVDVLINISDAKAVSDILQKCGYLTHSAVFDENEHTSYTKSENGLQTVCEVHYRINGIPKQLKEKFDIYLSDIFEQAKEINLDSGKCLAPCKLHHGIILLLHTATHLVHEGIGLRHLCDWAVFVNSFTNDEFVSVFETPLKEFGLWHFASLLTLCCEKYLGIERKDWAGDAEDGLLEDIMTDILNGGNFGTKDYDRYNQIKYISDRNSRKTDNRNAFVLLLSNVNYKAKSNYRFVKKCKLLLPIGWIAVSVKYLWLLLKGERKIDSIDTINNANKRKNIYKEFKLFE